MAELPEGWTAHMAERPAELDLTADWASDAEAWQERVHDAIDLASDQDEMTWLLSDGKRVAAVVTTEEGEAAERRRYAPLTGAEPDPAAEALNLVREQARTYLEARFGKNVWFRAPETFEGAFDRWIWAVASGCEATTGAEAMTAIADHFRAQ
jgi:hypothetical protein